MTLFEKASRALYGITWQASLADALGVNKRTVRRWHRGDSPVPDGAWREIYALLVERSGECRAIAAELMGGKL